jgi:hypothetical protein
MMQLECHAGVLNGRAARFSFGCVAIRESARRKKTGEICSPVLPHTRNPG